MKNPDVQTVLSTVYRAKREAILLLPSLLPMVFSLLPSLLSLRQQKDATMTLF